MYIYTHIRIHTVYRMCVYLCVYTHTHTYTQSRRKWRDNSGFLNPVKWGGIALFLFLKVTRGQVKVRRAWINARECAYKYFSTSLFKIIMIILCSALTCLYASIYVFYCFPCSNFFFGFLFVSLLIYIWKILS